MGNLVKSVGNALGLSTPKVNQGAFAPNAQEQQYIDQLQGFANGSAPSAAAIQMQQGIDQATAQAQALAASQRGISPALAARYAAQTQGALTQGAASQGAMLRANEQANYMGMLGNELQSVRTGAMAGAQLQNQNENAAAGRMSNLIGGIGSALLGGGSSKAQQEKPDQSMVFAGNPMMAQNFQGTQMAAGGMVTEPGLMAVDPNRVEQKSMAGEMAAQPQNTQPNFSFAAGLGHVAQPPPTGQSMSIAPAIGATTPVAQSGQQPGRHMLINPFVGRPMGGMIGTMMADGGEVNPDGPQSHTVQFLSQALYGGGPVMRADYQSGGTIPGQARVAGDSLNNDVVPIMASPGEIMLPRSVTMGNNPGEKAKAFVDKIKASQKKAK